MTPRQFDMLCRRHKADLLHREMGAAYTTAAVINSSQWRPEEPISATVFMPNHSANSEQDFERQWDEDTLARMSDYNVRVAEEAVRQREQAAERG